MYVLTKTLNPRKMLYDKKQRLFCRDSWQCRQQQSNMISGKKTLCAKTSKQTKQGKLSVRYSVLE